LFLGFPTAEGGVRLFLNDVLLLLVGLVVLVKGADLLVDGASSIAARIGVPPLVVGLTIVSFGTSLPEMLVTLNSGLRNNAELAIANVIGSNICNLLVVLGVAAIIRPLPVRDSTVVSELPFSLTAALLVGFLANVSLFAAPNVLSISRLDGGILLFFFFLFMLYVYGVARRGKFEYAQTIETQTLTTSVLYIIGGVVALYFGGQWTVDGAVGLARDLQVDDALIGLTVIAIGTSAPELVASAVAAYRGQTDVAVGNVVGSNIFNLLWVLGFTASIVELPFEAVSNTDLVMVILASAMVILALVTSGSSRILRTHGFLFVIAYVAYMAYVIERSI
jgi:cation:H+ antiporter